MTRSDHAFIGDGPHCQAWIRAGVLGNAQDGTLSMRTRCGYPLDSHPAAAALVDTAIRAGAQAERERIVAWLRKEADTYVVEPAGGALENAADQIEKGV